MRIERRAGFGIAQLAVAVILGSVARPAQADLVVSQLIVDLSPERPTGDVEIHNDSAERQYIVIEPSEIVAAGTPDEKRIAKRNPRDLGLLVSMQRLILEPGQRRMVRLALIGQTANQERVYRVIVRPVVGDVSAPASGLKLLVGYDMLVLARPAEAKEPILTSSREGNRFTLTNRGNTSVELTNGSFCQSEQNCEALPGKRLYAGASWTQSLPTTGVVKYSVRSRAKWTSISF